MILSDSSRGCASNSCHLKECSTADKLTALRSIAPYYYLTSAQVSELEAQLASGYMSLSFPAEIRDRAPQGAFRK